MQQQGKIEITLDDARQNNLAECEQSVILHSSLNLIQELFCFPSKEKIRLLCHCMHLIQVKTNNKKGKADLGVPSFPQILCTPNA